MKNEVGLVIISYEGEKMADQDRLNEATRVSTDH